MQSLLCRAVWDADAVRDELRYIVDELGDPGGCPSSAAREGWPVTLTPASCSLRRTTVPC
jgi:hypothetical protein